MPVESDSLLHELRRGERDAFTRFFELYRASVYDLARRMLHDDAAAAAATVEVFTRAYRDVLLHDEGVGLRALTCRATLQVCRERLVEETTGGVAASATTSAVAAGSAVATASERREETDLGRRFGQALETLPIRFQAALLMHDVTGLRAGELAVVFGVTEEAAGALLFRAREEFRRSFEKLSATRSTTGCRLAEQAAAGAVGRSLSADEVRRLDEHAAYCRPCRRTMKGWGGRAMGLALFLEAQPLPPALETTPVFGAAAPIAGALGAAAGYGLVGRVLVRTGRALTSKAAAYALAAACLALAIGIATQLPQGDRSFVLLPGAALRLPQGAPSATSAARPSPARSGAAATRAPVATQTHVASNAALVSSSTGSAESDATGTEPTTRVVAYANTPEPAATLDVGARPPVPSPAASAQDGESAGSAQPNAGHPGAFGAVGHDASSQRVVMKHGKAKARGHASSWQGASGHAHGDRARHVQASARQRSRQSHSHRDRAQGSRSYKGYAQKSHPHSRQSHSHRDRAQGSRSYKGHAQKSHPHQKSKKNH
jgi:RNA polymerase sigma-70 factor, ECF subfamily